MDEMHGFYVAPSTNINFDVIYLSMAYIMSWLVFDLDYLSLASCLRSRAGMQGMMQPSNM